LIVLSKIELFTEILFNHTKN